MENPIFDFFKLNSDDFNADLGIPDLYYISVLQYLQISILKFHQI